MVVAELVFEFLNVPAFFLLLYAFAAGQWALFFGILAAFLGLAVVVVLLAPTKEVVGERKPAP